MPPHPLRASLGLSRFSRGGSGGETAMTGLIFTRCSGDSDGWAFPPVRRRDGGAARDGMEARGSLLLGHLTPSLQKDLPPKSSQYSTPRPTLMDSNCRTGPDSAASRRGRLVAAIFQSSGSCANFFSVLNVVTDVGIPSIYGYNCIVLRLPRGAAFDYMLVTLLSRISGFAGTEPVQRHYRPLQSHYESLRSHYGVVTDRCLAVTSH